MLFIADKGVHNSNENIEWTKELRHRNILKLHITDHLSFKISMLVFYKPLPRLMYNLIF